MSFSILGRFPISLAGGPMPLHLWSEEEWDNVLSHLPLSPTDPWTSLLVTGTLAIINPEDAYSRHRSMGMVKGMVKPTYWKTHQRKVRFFRSRLRHHKKKLPEIHDYILHLKHRITIINPSGKTLFTPFTTVDSLSQLAMTDSCSW